MLGFKADSGISVTDQPGELTHRSIVATQNAYATAFPTDELPFGGSGWSHGFSDGGLWNNIRTASGKAFGTQVNGGAQFLDGIAHLNGVWLADQSVSSTITFANSPSTGDSANVFEEVEILLRFSITQGRAIGYECLWSVVPDATFGRYIQLARWDGGAGSFVTLTNGTSTLAVVGDTFSASIIGTVVTIQVNGVTKLTWDTAGDASRYASGAPGIGHYFGNDSSLGTYAPSDYGLTSYRVTAA